MALATITDIKAAAADWLNRSDLTSQINDFYSLTLSDVARKLKIPLMENVQDKTISSDEATAKKFLEPYAASNIISITDSKGNILEPVDFREYKQYIDDSGSAKVFSHTGGFIYIGSPPAANDVFTIQYKYLYAEGLNNYQSALGVAGLTNFYDLLLYGILMHACVYLKDDNRVPLFKQKYDELIIDVNRNIRLNGRIKDESIAVNGGPLA